MTKRKNGALIRLGKTIYLRFGNFLRRVAIEKVRPDVNGEIDLEESYVDQENEDSDDERFQEEETPVVDMTLDLDLNEKNKELQKRMEDLSEKDALNLKKIESSHSKFSMLLPSDHLVS